ncbi:MAG TPA: methyl-accepting chemotaxis protein, partial [candidate division Zixibacteria bacterium]|nr:methyl-accepting chemotaxis protein [candidate division Zixibacteria bacterium]
MKLRLTAKFMIGVALILSITMVANMIFTNKRVNAQEELAFADKLRQITGMATQIRTWAAAHQNLYRTANQMPDGKLNISTVPVVQAWQVAQDYATSMGFEFRTPSLTPRNPDNMAVGFEREALLAFQNDRSLTEYWERGEDTNGEPIMRFAAPVYLSEECMSCHGNPQGELDPFGYAKEGMKSGDLRAAFVVKASAAELAAHEAANTQFMLWSTLIIIALVCGGIYFFTRKMVTGPISTVVGLTNQMTEEFEQFTHVVDAIANNDLTQNIKESTIQKVKVKSNDEIGELVAAVEGSLSAKEKIGSSMIQMTDNLKKMVSELRDSSTLLASSSTEISSSAEQMASGAQQQTGQTQQVSTAVEEMTATVIETSKNAAEASDVATKASEIATAGSEIVGQTISGMQRIADVVQSSAQTIGDLAKSADQIGEIIGVIDDIADQTNLLALNAAIEAARAGEQGRGFAVVADEVRKLAERTTKATAEITEMIKGIQTDTGNAVRSMEEGTAEVQRGREMA